MPDNPLNRGMNVGSDLIPAAKSDTVDLATPGRAIRCRPDGAAGTVKFNTNGGTPRTTYIAAGETLLVAVTRIWDTGTSATNLEVLI